MANLQGQYRLLGHGYGQDVLSFVNDRDDLMKVVGTSGWRST